MKNETEMVNNISTINDMSDFLILLAKDAKEKPEEWANATLSDYFESISAWIKDSPGLENNLNISNPKNVDWKFIAKIILAGKYYE